MKEDSTPPRPRKARLKLLGKQLEPTQFDPASRKQAAAVLEVLAGLRTPQQASQALGISLPTYFNLETRALGGLIQACAPYPRGRQPSLAPQLHQANTKLAQLEKELGRYRALLRTAQRSVGLAAPPLVEPKPRGKGKRKKPAVRALRAIQLLQQPGQTPPSTDSTRDPTSMPAVAAE